MAQFNVEQTMAVVAVQQLLSDWSYDLDFTDCSNIGKYLTDDVVYHMGTPLTGIPAVHAFYKKLFSELGDPTRRHMALNFRVSFVNPNEVKVTFSMLWWTSAIPGINPTDIGAIADVWMTCRRGGDGEWKIARFESVQPLKRVS
jgi:ketosteroid isomerase-like protein